MNSFDFNFEIEYYQRDLIRKVKLGHGLFDLLKKDEEEKVKQ